MGWRRLFVGLLFLTLLHREPLAGGQTGPPLNRPSEVQARSQEEFDAYLASTTAAEPHLVIHEAEAFARRYPASELLGLVYQAEMRAFESTGNWNGLLAAGQRALLAQPDNLNTLLTLAPAIVNHPEMPGSRIELLQQADQLARRALAAIEKTRPPHEVGIEAWKARKGDMQSRCHEVLGVVALNRGQPKVGVQEFRASIELTPTPQGSQVFRLAVAYSAAGETKEAEAAFRRAAQLGPENVRILAQVELKRMSSSLQRPSQ